MAKTVKAQIELGGKVDGSLLKSMATAEKQMALLKKGAGGIHKAASAAMKAAGVAAVAAGAATAKVVKDSVGVGKQFDSSMAQVAATMGKSVDEIGDLRKFALDMGKTTMFSASQAADALNYMALAGYDADTSMKMLPNVLNLAAAGGMELATASDMVTDASSALGLSLDETSALVDKMAKASSKSNTSVAQLGEALLVVGGTAKSMKGGTTEVSQALGLLADNGIKGAEGGTALRNVLLGLSSDKFYKTFGELGVSAYDAQGNMRSLEDVFLDMNAAMADMTVEEKTQALSSAFNKVDLKSLNALLGTSRERWEELAAAIDDSAGAAEQMAKTQMDNLAGDITYFQSAMEGAQITLSDALTPALREFVQFGTNGLGEITRALDSYAFTSFAKNAAEGMTSAAEGAYEFLFGVAEEFDENGTLIKERSAGMFEGLFEGIDFDGLAEAFNGLGSAIAAALGDGSEAASAKGLGGAIASAINAAIPAIELATPIIANIAGVLKFLADNAETIAPIIGGVAIGFMTMEAVSGVAGVITSVGAALGVVGGAGTAAGAGLTATAGGSRAAGAAAASSVGQLLAMGGAVLMIGGGVALAALGLGIMAQSAIALASAGAPAIGVMFGLVGVVFALGAAVYFAGPALTAGAVGMMAFSVAALLVGAGIGIASAGIALLAAQLPLIAEYGMMAGPALLLMGTGLLLMGAGALVAGAGLLVAAPGLLAFTAAALPASAAIGALGAAVGLVAGPIVDMGNAVGNAGWGVQSIADNALPAADGLNSLSASSQAVADGVNAAAPGIVELGTAAQGASGGLFASGSALAVILASTTALYMAASGSASAFGTLNSGVQGVAAGSSVASAALTALSGSASASAGVVRVSSQGMVAALLTLPGATSPGVAAFTAFAAGVSGAMSRAQGSVASACSAMESKVSGMHLTIPTIHVAALPHFSMSGDFNPETKAVPTVSVSYYAAGGFTNGPIAIAGEAGTEAIISFDPRYRDENIAYWLAAGQMLGMLNPFAEGGFTDGTASDLSFEIASPTGLLATAAGETGAFGASGGVNLGGVTFAPQITVSGTGNQDVLEQLKTAEDDFRDMIEDIVADLESSYAPVL